MKKQFTSFFMRNGVPADDLTPTITISEITDNVLMSTTSGTMILLGSGIYGFSWNDYNPNSEYIINVDGGSSLHYTERYQIGSNVDFKDVWQIDKSTQLSSGTMGAVANATLADVQQVRIDVTVVKNTLTPMVELLELLRKHQANRTVVDVTTNTLTVFDDDGVTELQTFKLYDGSGNPSITQILERVPV